MSLRDEFHHYLKREWPLWKRHAGGAKYNQMYKAFGAGFRLGDDGPAPETLREARGRAQGAAEFMNAKPRKFKPPKVRP